MSAEVMELKLDDWKNLEQVTPVKVLLTVLYILILILGIIGNSITIRVTRVLQHNGYLQKSVTDHMVSLACSDLLVLLIGMPVELYSAIWCPFSSVSGNVSCKIYNFLFEACSYATILNVATLSFERYVAICHPLKYKSISGSRTVRLIVFAWVTSLLVAIPVLFTTGTEGPSGFNGTSSIPDGDLMFCTNLSSMWTAYQASIFVAFIVYIIVLVSVGVMCKRMIFILAKINRKSTNKDNRTGSFLPKHENAKARESRTQTIWFLALIVVSLATCWMPNQIRRIMTAARHKVDWTMPYFQAYVTLHPIADTFFYLSSVLNPFLYNLSSQQFRQVFLQVLRCKLTIEHINKRNVRRSSARSMRPLMLQSLQRARSSHSSSPKPHGEASTQQPELNTPPNSHTADSQI